MATGNIYGVGNAGNTSKYKPKEAEYDDSWIDFWKDQVGMKKPQNCCVEDCTHEKPFTADDIVGGHVYMSSELSKAIETDLDTFCNYPLRRPFNGFLCNNGYWYKVYGTLIVMMRCGDELVKTEGENVVCIAPICNSCNQRTDNFMLNKNTVIVPLYWSDQKEVGE